MSHVAYSYATHVVLLDANGMLEKVVAAHDVGRAINPVQVEAQIEGGVVMGLGLRPDRGLPAQGRRAAGQVRHARPLQGLEGPADRVGHHREEPRPEGVRRQGPRRDRHDSDGARGGGRLLQPRRRSSAPSCRSWGRPTAGRRRDEPRDPPGDRLRRGRTWRSAPSSRSRAPRPATSGRGCSPARKG